MSSVQIPATTTTSGANTAAAAEVTKPTSTVSSLSSTPRQPTSPSLSSSDPSSSIPVSVSTSASSDSDMKRAPMEKEKAEQSQRSPSSSPQQPQQEVGFHNDHLWPFDAPLSRSLACGFGFGDWGFGGSSLLSHHPWFDSPLERSLWSGFDNRFNQLAAQPMKKMMDGSSMRMDWRDTDTNYQLAVDLPGVPKDSIKLDVNGRKLTVTAEQMEEKKDESTGWYCKSSGKTQRTITLPANADIDSINAKCIEGQLRIIIPKKATTPSDRPIPIE